MVWDEVDLDARLWTVPAERMKAHREHRVPSARAPYTSSQRLAVPTGRPRAPIRHRTTDERRHFVLARSRAAHPDLHRGTRSG